jgi:hypothetical protein
MRKGIFREDHDLLCQILQILTKKKKKKREKISKEDRKNEERGKEDE